MLLIFIRPSTTAELNTIKYINVEIMNCIVSFKYESEVMITARPNHRPTRQECLLISQFENQTQETFLINFPDIQLSIPLVSNHPQN